MTALPGTPCTRSTIDRWYIWYDIIQLYIIYTYMWHMNMYVCMSVCMYIYIYDTGSLHKTPMRRYELAKIRIVTRIFMYVYVRWYKCIDIQNSELQHLYMCRSIYFRSCRCWLQLRIGKVPNSVVGAIAVVDGMKMGPLDAIISWRFWWGVPQSWMELTHIHTWPHTHTTIMKPGSHIVNKHPCWPPELY